MDDELEAYRLGRTYAVMPIPMDDSACRAVAAGPVTFLVEDRHLDDEAIVASAEAQGRREEIDEPSGVDDGGPSLHVVGTADGREHLRFDCFDQHPHYHYIRVERRENVVVRIDTHAEGDPRTWALDRVRRRLPEMLEHAGATGLADAVRASASEVAAAVDYVADLMAPPWPGGRPDR
ncbi:hypothetical protein PO878_03715 [Iamia majanohamensis]|uniref:DUF7700 domain-containing protein n=1 Tax=Iamia majanohamensis TaxID=467976 RepID=A0AAE9Y6X8_9ACTN|nr:hypothetical protein [Iamia majanohamensis]WCO67830.1 hypothetical protein PO878_03715 [Iamia majanohamensis]